MKRYLWSGVFVVFFALSLDYWNWGRASLGWLGVPSWLYYFVGLQLAFAVAMMAFSMYYWEERDVG